ncbi:copper chaperone PCu(A)C [Albidovulum sp.]|uniref:copper chaperone PCu(A)C n=1 Tax=Albidovulum sp. TaxID=1872424 RepID=UPI003D7CE8C2
MGASSRQRIGPRQIRRGRKCRTEVTSSERGRHHADAGSGRRIAIPPGETHELARGGDHVMFMDPKREVKEGDRMTVTLTFYQAGEATVDIRVDNAE